MTTIEELSIRGIRNFGVEDDQKIHFSLPLTTIVGANGAGKTATIEALSFALTGKFPTSSDQFIHNPDMLDIDETQANVSIILRNRNGEKYEVIRSSSVSKKKGYISTGVTFAKIDDNGKHIIEGFKIAKVNRLALQTMNVSEVIVNDVLLCHQDNSNWPLDNDSKLKDKFEAIFESKKFTRFSDKIRETIKKGKDDKQNILIDIQNLQKIKTDANQIRLLLNRNQKEYNDLVTENEIRLNKEKKLKEEINETDNQIQEMTKKDMERIICENNLKNKLAHEEEQSYKVKNKSMSSSEDLKFQIERILVERLENENKLHNSEDSFTKAAANEVTAYKELQKIENILELLRKREVGLAEDSSTQLKEILAEIYTKQSLLEEDVSVSGNASPEHTTITLKRQQRDDKNTELNQTEKNISDLILAFETTVQIAAKNQNINDKEAQILNIEQNHNEKLKSLFNSESFDEDTIAKIEIYNKHLTDKIRQKEAKIRICEKDKEIKIDIENLKKEIPETVVSNMLQFDEDLESSEKRFFDCQTRRIHLKSREMFINECLQKLKDQPCCENTLKRIEAHEIEYRPEELRNIEQEMEAERTNLHMLYSVKSSIERIRKLESLIKSNGEKNSGDSIFKELHNLKREVDGIKTQSDDIASMITDLTLLNNARRNIEQNKIELEELKAKLPTPFDKNNCNLSQLFELRRQLTTDIKTLDDQIAEEEKLLNENEKLELKDTISRISNAANGFMVMKKEIDDCESKLKELKIDYKEKIDEVKLMRDKTDLIKNEISTEIDQERDLKENLVLKNIQSEIFEIKVKLQNLPKSNCLNDLEMKSSTLKQKMENLREEIHKTRGQIEEKLPRINELKEHVNRSKYINAEVNLKMKQNEEIVIEKGLKDLELICTEIDNTITKFHYTKMKKINARIKLLWEEIYSGNDIQYIQIKTEETKKIGQRRSYTYRVCAFKNGKSFDARGHFSAGQRVLACIIIRLALAEVFAGHCGILALDEPTTNLDQANISSLAKSLNKLVEEREFQNNFMLLIITHDENFMGKMGRPGKCYRIERNVLDGTSRIKENND